MNSKEKCQRVILEAFYKICELVLDSRGFKSSSTKRRSRSKHNKPHPSFNLVMDKKRDVRNALKGWKLNPHRVLYLNIYFEEPSAKKKFLLERFSLEYRPKGSKVDEKTSTLLRLVYKKIAVFLRSLISFVRIVPAYDVARRFRAQISYDISSPEEEEEESLEKKNPTFDCVVSNVHFTPIVAPFGTLIVSSMYRRNMSLDGKLIAETTMTSPSMISNQDSRQRRRSWTPTQKTNMIDDTDDWIVPRRTSILQDYDKRDSFERYRYSPYGRPPPRSPLNTMTSKDVPHSAPATARTGFHMLERHMLDKRNGDGNAVRLFQNKKSKESIVTQSTEGIPISTSLAKPKLVRRISRSADDKEFGKYWKELPKQMRRVEEEEEEEDEDEESNLATRAKRKQNYRPRRDTDVHRLAFGSPPLGSINEQKSRRPSIASSPGETPPFASTTTPNMSITPLRLVGSAFKNCEKNETKNEIEISFHRSSSSLNEEDVVTTEEGEMDFEEEELPFAMHDVEDEFQDDESSTTNLTTEFERLKKSDSGIGELVATCDSAPMLRSIEIARESGAPYSRRDIDRKLDFFESFERTLNL